MSRRSREREMAELIARAIEQTAAFEERHQTMFVQAKRIMRRKSLQPTDHQEQLLRWIKRQGFVPREIALGMHFGMLGGLMARGLVVEVIEKGVRGVRSTE
jgi:hypothetical protein